jgi:hypothetical protein
MKSVGVLLYGLLVSSAFVATGAVAGEMTTIDDYLKRQKSPVDTATENFVYLRCAALFGMVGEMTKNEASLQKESKGFLAAGSMFYSLVIDSGAGSKYALDQIGRMNSAYLEIGLNSKAQSGDFFRDDLLVADMKTCGALASGL